MLLTPGLTVLTLVVQTLAAENGTLEPVLLTPGLTALTLVQTLVAVSVLRMVRRLKMEAMQEATLRAVGKSSMLDTMCSLTDADIT